MSIPSGLSLVSEFVNTRSPEAGRDAFDEPGGLAAWLSERGLPAGTPSQADVQRARRLREALRSLLLAHNGAPVDPEAVDACNAVARRAPLNVVVDAGGDIRLEPAGDGVDAALGRILAVVERARAEGTWDRLKACAADDCRWVYYDRSRNRSRTWCDMAVCGNRAKARAYRSRHPQGD